MTGLVMVLCAASAAAWAAPLTRARLSALAPLPRFRALGEMSLGGATVPRRRWRRRPKDTDGDLPVLLDLLSVCVGAGLPPSAALALVGRWAPGPTGPQLAGVARALGLGASSAQAWERACAALPALRRVADLLTQAERSGAAVAPALTALAADRRRALGLRRARATRRVGVLATAPLGLCFLPAFVLTGVVPVVAGLVSTVTET